MSNGSPCSTDPSSNVLGIGRHTLKSFFRPKSVAVIGATESEGTVGRTLFRNLLQHPFGGPVYPVNPKRQSILGVRAYPSIHDVPDLPELAVIATPAPTVPDVIRQCGESGIHAAIVISAGFREVGPEGAELERRVLEEARRGGVRIIGPNCLGVMHTRSGLNATFAAGMALTGSVGFLSQSGALATSILDWSLREMVGFSAFVSVGSMVDVGWGDLIEYMGEDPYTESILIYMESIGDARSFMAAAREVALTKPIIVIKAGRSEAAAKAAASHTGALTGSDDVLDAAFRRCGVLRVDRIADLFSMAEVLARQPRPRGRRLTVVTNAGGPGVLATDALTEGGGELAPVSADVMTSLNEILPAAWSHNNPIDVLGDAPPERYSKAVEIASRDPQSDGILVILTPQAMTDPTRTAEAIRPFAKLVDRPIVASWMGGADVAAGESILNRAGIPTFSYPDTAARAFNGLWHYSENLRALYETPTLARNDCAHDPEEATELFQRVLADGRTLLTEEESKRLLAAYCIPVTETVASATEDEAVKAAESLGYPVVLKLLSKTITHKTDVGGVRLNLGDEDAVRAAYRRIKIRCAEHAGAEAFQGVTVQPMIERAGIELILGSSIDPQFGPVLLFGAGGQLVEVFKDRSLGLPPLTSTLARRLIERTRIYKAFGGVRGRKPVDVAMLEQILVRFSRLVVEQPRIKEIDINPLLASDDGLIALDARVVLHPAEVPDELLPRPAVRPYPLQYVKDWTLHDGTPVTIRPIRPEDEPMMVRFYESLSRESVYRRYFHAMAHDQLTAHDRLTRICFTDFERQMALVAERAGISSEDREILAACRLRKAPGGEEAELTMLVSDAWQSKGLGTELMRRLLEIARIEGLRRIKADVLAENSPMLDMVRRFGFQTMPQSDPTVISLVLNLTATPQIEEPAPR